ncbi:MAG: shikimate dehydrogenase [Alphaproteobacteria bacterium]|nr:shikimate dehydrogenase [Alphaproteobacteria bacterium]MDE2109635.1 shikimate dehydrogenase [Alphaproteobacteria bacterium]MDE2493055.1 shikimate dehydrogenase [Alphaproteobacteria bacterium]
MNITGAAELAGVAGWPVAHSLSPRLHGHWIREYGLDAAYVPLAIRKEDFAKAVNGLRLAGFKGINVTIPHKEAAFALADYCDHAAEIAGAANLLLFGENGVEARNTDPAGLSASLCQGMDAGALKGRKAAVWGAGGMARAACCALSGLGAAEICIFNRHVGRAQNLAASVAPKIAAKLVAADYGEWPAAAENFGVLVHATSAGMNGTPSLDLPLDGLPRDATVVDGVYSPLETGLLARAKAEGLNTVDGLGMLMHQAVPAFAAFYGVEPEVTAALRSMLEEALDHGR